MPVTLIPKRLVSCELIGFAARDPEAFVSLCEDRYDARIDAAARRILDCGAKLIMLTGPSGSGKTTSALRLSLALRALGKPAEIINLDDFFVGQGKYPKRADGSDDYECPEALDLPQLRQCMNDLISSGRCMVPRFDFLRQQPSGEYRLLDSQGGVVIIEGLHAFNSVLLDRLPPDAVFKVYVSLSEEYSDEEGRRSVCTRDVRLARRLVRDGLFRGHGADFTLDLWPHVCAAENQYIRPFKKTADLILDTSFSYESCIWEKLLLGMTGPAPGTPNAKTFERLCGLFGAFPPLEEELIPADSILREFIGEN